MIDLLIDEGVAESVGDEDPLPSTPRIEAAVKAAAAAAGLSGEPELCIRFADDGEVQALNRQWRQKDAATDVLSFPMQEGPDFDAGESLGDIIIAVPYTRRVAAELSLKLADHVLRLIIHATLHLMGYDHIIDADAGRMHAIERRVMLNLGLYDPYPEDEEQ